MTGLDRYFSFGVRAEWVETFCNYDCGPEFWISDGNGLVANKKKDAFKNFVQDAGLVVFDKKRWTHAYCSPYWFWFYSLRPGFDLGYSRQHNGGT